MEIFPGVVENRKDPLQLGRYQVRIVGLHNPDKNVLPTEDLPWSTPFLGTSSAGVSGIGATPTGLVEGSSVFIVYHDKDRQQPFIMSSVPGRPAQKAEKNSKVGFQDGAGVYPFNPMLEESDLHRTSRNVKTEETNVVSKKASQVQKIEIAGGKKWDQPPTPYDTTYPYTNVFNSEGGHTVEMDNTYGKERLNISHKSGTYTEMNPDGSVTNRIRGDNFTIMEKSGAIIIKGACAITVDGNAYVKVNNALTVDVSGTATVNILNNANLNVSGALNISVVDSLNIQASAINMEAYMGDICLKAAGNIYTRAERNVEVTTGNNVNIDTKNLIQLNCGFASEPKMNALEIPKSRKYPKSPNVGKSVIT